MDKEMAWKKERLGRITASELGDLFSASGKIIDGNVDYVRHKRFERLRGFSYPVSSKNFDIGHEQESYAIEWFRHNYPEVPIIYAMELPLIPIWVADFANFSASPDAFTEDESIVIEVKTVVSNGNAEFYADELTSFEDKLASVKNEHGMQLAGQFLSNPKVKEIWVLKYIYQRDECDEDISSPLDPWRGIIFKFKREDFDLAKVASRIKLFDLFIDSNYESKALKTLKLHLESETGDLKDAILKED